MAQLQFVDRKNILFGKRCGLCERKGIELQETLHRTIIQRPMKITRTSLHDTNYHASYQLCVVKGTFVCPVSKKLELLSRRT